MFKMCSEMATEQRSKLGGNGVGSPSFRYLFSREELGERANMISVVTLQPGESISEHSHTENGEIYFVLSGCMTVTDDEECRELHPGDAEFCADGHRHSACNHTDAPASFLAVILPNR